jgi:hypothetical protein
MWCHGGGLVRATGIMLRPMDQRMWKACAALAPFVEEFGLREDRLGKMQLYNPLPARM